MGIKFSEFLRCEQKLRRCPFTRGKRCLCTRVLGWLTMSMGLQLCYTGMFERESGFTYLAAAVLMELGFSVFPTAVLLGGPCFFSL